MSALKQIQQLVVLHQVWYFQFQQLELQISEENFHFFSPD